jgi:hypothetical protein
MCGWNLVSIVIFSYQLSFTLGGLVVSVLATGPMGFTAVGSGLAEDGGFLLV